MPKAGGQLRVVVDQERPVRIGYLERGDGKVAFAGRGVEVKASECALVYRMAEDYTVQQGDCLSSIALDHGFFWETLWNHGANADLKQKRKDPNVLKKGDVIHIPDLRAEEESGATEQAHRFRLKGVPAKLKIRVVLNDQPKANQPYRICIDGLWSTGTTDAEGFVEASLPPNARKGQLTVGEGDDQDIFELRFGHIDPIDTDEGIAGRLLDLGYSLQDGLPSAIRAFQLKEGLEETGAANEATRGRLEEKFGQ